MRIPFSAFLVSDEWALIAYEHHEPVEARDVRRHLYMLGREQDTYRPDYCFENDFKAEMEVAGCNDHSSTSEIIVCVLKYLAERYLTLQANRLYVKREMLEEWMEVVRVFPPLLIEAAFFVDFVDYERDEQDFYQQVLIPNFATTAIKLPYFKNLEKMVKDANGLTDLHVHINGTTETDILWWSEIWHVDKWFFCFDKALYDYEVQMEREQLVTMPLKEFKERIRKSGRILQDLIRYLSEKSNHSSLFTSYYDFKKVSQDRPLLATGAYFYLKMLTMMKKQQLPVEIIRKFHQFVLSLGTIHKMLVQQEWQKGFRQFQMITNNGFRWLYEANNIEARIAQLNGNKDFGILHHIEGRFSPKVSLKANKILINKILKGYNDYCAKKGTAGKNVDLRLVAHFIKQKDKFPTGRWIRHRELRDDVRKKGYALYDWLKYSLYKDRDMPVVGIDGAANEMDAGPEVFAPTFKWLKHKWRNHNKNLQTTYHAGEDFSHLLSGLRMMVEAVFFLEMEEGDRIGHGTAAGINPELWMNRMDEKIKMKKGEWLDDLLMVFDLISDSSKRFDDLMLLLPKLHHEIEDLHKEIYGAYNSINEMIYAWKLRKYDADVFLKKQVRCDEPDFDEKERISKRLEAHKSSKELWGKYHYDEEIKKRYEAFHDVKIKDGIFTVESLCHIQSLVLDKIARKGIALETLLTSNKAISFYREIKEHHLERWLADSTSEDDGCLIPAVVIGCDDPGIFMTNIYIEYARIVTYLETKNYCYTERMHILRDLIANSEYYKFGE